MFYRMLRMTARRVKGKPAVKSSKIGLEALDAKAFQSGAVLGVAEARQTVDLVVFRELPRDRQSHLTRWSGDQNLFVLEHASLHMNFTDVSDEKETLRDGRRRQSSRRSSVPGARQFSISRRLSGS